MERIETNEGKKKMWVLSFTNEDGENQAICIIPDEKFRTDELREYLKEKLQEYVCFSYEEDKDHPDFCDMKQKYEELIEDVTFGYQSTFSDYVLFFEEIDIV